MHKKLFIAYFAAFSVSAPGITAKTLSHSRKGRGKHDWCIKTLQILFWVFLAAVSGLWQPALAAQLDGGRPGIENNVTITNRSAKPQNNYPLQFARLFLKGEIRNYPQVLIDGTAVTTQANVKQRWTDGSVKHAIMSLVVPSLPAGRPVRLTFQNNVTENTAGLSRKEMLSKPFDFDAAISLTSGGTTKQASARRMLENGDYTVWASGPVATTIVLADHSPARKYDIGFDNHRPFRPIFHATFWPALNKVEIRFIGELANTEELTDVPADFTLRTGSANPKNVYTSQPRFVHRLATRWTRTYWLGQAPEEKVDIDHNLTYLKETRVFPNYDTSFKVPDATVASLYARWGKIPKDLYDAGLWQKAMWAPGGRDEIGPMPGVAVLWLYTGDWRMKEIVTGQADLAGAWRLHFREGDRAKNFLRSDAPRAGTGFGKTVSLTDRKTLNLLHLDSGAPGDRVKVVGPLAASGWGADDAHQPEPFGALYALTGDPYYLEELYFWAGSTAAMPAAAGTLGSRGPTGAEGGLGGQFRGQAWTLRSRAVTAYLAPDGAPEKRYFETLIDDAMAIFEGKYDVKNGRFNGTPLWRWANNLLVKAVPDGHYNNRLRFLGKAPATGLNAPWEVHFMIYAWGLARDMGYPTDGMVKWIAPWLTGMILDPAYNPYLIGAYRQPEGPVGQPHIYYTDWATVLSNHTSSERVRKEFVGVGDLVHGYPNFGSVAVSFITDQPDGGAAWSWMKANAYDRNLQRWPTNPKLAILPRVAAAQ